MSAPTVQRVGETRAVRQPQGRGRASPPQEIGCDGAGFGVDLTHIPAHGDGTSDQPTEASDAETLHTVGQQLDLSPKPEMQRHLRRPPAPATAPWMPSVSLPPAARDAVAGGGAPLREGVRQAMEDSFSHDFSSVRVHTDDPARRGANALYARAFNVGDHIVLGPGIDQADHATMAHELAHIVHRRRGAGTTPGVGATGALEDDAAQAASHASAGETVIVKSSGLVPAVQLDRVEFRSGETHVTVEDGAVSIDGIPIQATVGPEGRLYFNNREIVLDRAGLFVYRDRYTRCYSCNPKYYEGTKRRPGVVAPELTDSFYDITTRKWVLRREPVVTTAKLSPAASPARPGPVDPDLQQTVQRAHVAREQYEARVEQAVAKGRSRAEAEELVRRRMAEQIGESGLGSFETGQTYAVVEVDLESGALKRTTTAARRGGEKVTVEVPLSETKARLAQINQTLGENFSFTDRQLQHAELRGIVRTPGADTYYVNRPMCPFCQRFYLLESMAQNRKITVVGPETTRVFTPSRRIVEYYPKVVYERVAAVTRAGDTSTLEIGNQPSVTHSVQAVPRTGPEAPDPASTTPASAPRPAEPTTKPGESPPSAESKNAKPAQEGEPSAKVEPKSTAGKPSAATTPDSAKPAKPAGEPAPKGGSKVPTPEIVAPPKATPRATPEPAAPRPGAIRPGALEPHPPRVGGIRGGGIRRLGGLGGAAALEAFSIVLMLVDVMIQLVVIPLLAILQKQMEDEYAVRLQKELMEYYETHLKKGVEDGILSKAEELKGIEDRDGQPYTNITFTVHFERRSWNLLTGHESGPPESVLDLSFAGLTDLKVAIGDAPVAESSGPLTAEDALPLIGDTFSTKFCQTVSFPTIPPTYQDLVNKYGPNPSSKASSCFIATACYGTPDAYQVAALRQFRDSHLMPYRAGRRFVAWYYRTSPPLADLLRRHPSWRWAVRTFFVAPLAALARRLDRPHQSASARTPGECERPKARDHACLGAPSRT